MFFVEPFSALSRKRTAASPVGTGRLSSARSSPLTISPMSAPRAVLPPHSGRLLPQVFHARPLSLASSGVRETSLRVLG